MKRILHRPVIVGAAIGAVGLTVVILAVSLTGGSDPGGTTTSATTSSGSTVSAARGWHNLAQCFRSHGYAIADPTVNADGTSSWTASGGNPPPRELRNAIDAVGNDACRSAFDALPAQLLDPPPTPAELHTLVLLAGCMREHGLTDWPDPNPDGSFPLDARLRALGKRDIVAKLDSCDNIAHLNGLMVSSPPGGGDK